MNKEYIKIPFIFLILSIENGFGDHEIINQKRKRILAFLRDLHIKSMASGSKPYWKFGV